MLDLLATIFGYWIALNVGVLLGFVLSAWLRANDEVYRP